MVNPNGWAWRNEIIVESQNESSKRKFEFDLRQEKLHKERKLHKKSNTTGFPQNIHFITLKNLSESVSGHSE